MVSELSFKEVAILLFILSTIFIASRLMGELFRAMRQPVVVGEIIAGIILGPSLLGKFFPEVFSFVFLSEPRSYAAFDGLANMGIIMLMFVAGLEVDIKQVKGQFRRAASISLMGLLIPFASGFCMVYLFRNQFSSNPGQGILIPALFFGTALSITALSVIAKVLMDLNMLKSKIGGLILTAAMIDDFLGWILFSIIIQMLNIKGEESSGMSIVIILLFVIFVLTIGIWIIDKLLMLADKYLTKPGGVITVSVCLCFLGAVFTEYLGIRGVFGAFLIGIAVGNSTFFSDLPQHILHQFIVNIIAPLFFTSIGLRINFIANFDITLVLIIFIAACVGKLVGAGVGSLIGGLKRNESFAIAFGMNARGSIAIVLGLSAMQANIINEKMFEGIVVMTVASILIAGPAMKYFFKKQEKTDRQRIAYALNKK